MEPEKKSKVQEMLDKLPIKVVSDGHGLIVYQRKGNPGGYEEIGRLSWDQGVGLYLNIKNEVEGNLFLRARKLEDSMENLRNKTSG